MRAGDSVQAEHKKGVGAIGKNEELCLLSGANPNWPKSTLADMMKMHLSTTTAEVVARLNGKWDDDIAAFDAVYAHILKMADALSDGIIKQFPAKFQ